MSEDPKPAEDAIPPRLSLKQTGAFDEGDSKSSSEADAKKQTRRVEMPQPPQAQETVANLKKKTARIPLEQVTAETIAAPGIPPAGMAMASKTIRLSPATPPPPSLSIPTSIPPVRTGMGGHADDGKRQTSRIPLESVMSDRASGAASEAGTSAAPKTIRIKRPSPGQAGKASSTEPEAGAQPPAQATVSAAKSSTSRLELVEEASPEGQPTQRKTIKIRRAEGGTTITRPGPRSVQVARLEAKIAEQEADEAATESIHVLYPVAAAVALLILCVMLYLLAAQAFPGANLSFPGKITL